MALDTDALKERALRVARGFSPSQLVIIGLLGVVAVVGGLAFVRWASTPSYGVLATNLAAQDAATVTAALQADGVPYRLADGGATVLVPAEQVDATRLSLSAAGLPKGDTVGYELLDRQGLTTSSFKQQVDYQRALEGELSRTLSDLDGVDSATVHIALPEERLFAEDARPARASVLVDPARPLSDDAVESIVHLVSAAVPDLAVDAVTVTDTNGRLLSSPGANTQGGKQLRLTHAYEDSLAAQAESMLATVLGPGHAVVRVSADLDFSERETESETYDPSKQATLREQTDSEKYRTDAPASGGTVTVTPTGAPAPQGATGNDYNKTSTSRELGVSRVVERSKTAPGDVNRLSVAVAVDSGLKNAPAPERIRELVAAATGIDAKRGDTIVVEQAAFEAPAGGAAAASGGKAGSAGPVPASVMGAARTAVGALVLLIVALALFRGMTRRRVEDLPVPAGETPVVPGFSGRAPALGAGAEARMALPSPRTESDALATLADTQPDEIAAMLRGWLSEGAR